MTVPSGMELLLESVAGDPAAGNVLAGGDAMGVVVSTILEPGTSPGLDGAVKPPAVL